MNTLNFDLIIIYLSFPQSVKTKVGIVTSNRTGPTLNKFLPPVQNSLSIYHCLNIWYSYNLYRSRYTLKWHHGLYEQLLRSSALLWKLQISKLSNFYTFIFLKKFSFKLWLLLQNIDQSNLLTWCPTDFLDTTSTTIYLPVHTRLIYYNWPKLIYSISYVLKVSNHI